MISPFVMALTSMALVASSRFAGAEGSVWGTGSGSGAGCGCGFTSSSPEAESGVPSTRVTEAHMPTVALRV